MTGLKQTKWRMDANPKNGRYIFSLGPGQHKMSCYLESVLRLKFSKVSSIPTEKQIRL